jgi:uncharacterized Zn-binding protein involved in type VI secretion
MGQPAAKMGDKIVAVDTHIFMIPAPPGSPVPTPLPSPFNGMIASGCSTNVMIEGKGAAVVGSTANNIPPHPPQGGPLQKPATNQGKIIMGSMTVMINNKPAARMGDTCETCNDPSPLPVGKVVVAGVPRVLIG